MIAEFVKEVVLPWYLRNPINLYLGQKQQIFNVDLKEKKTGFLRLALKLYTLTNNNLNDFYSI